MRLLFLLLLAWPVFAQDPSLEEKLKTLSEAREKAISDWKQANKFEKLPNKDYVTFYEGVWDLYISQEKKAYEEVCAQDKAKCLTPEKMKEVEVSSRMARNIVAVENAWAEQGKSEDERKASLDAYQKCVTQNEGCDKLSKEDQEKAKAARGPASEGPKKDLTFDEKKKQIHDDLLKLMKEMLAKFTEENPDWDKKDLTSEGKAFFLSMEDKLLEETLKRLEEICKEDKTQPACSEAAMASLKDVSAGQKCLIERKFQVNELPGDHAALRKKIDDNNLKEWDALKAPKDCKTLLEKDKTPVVDPADTTPEEEEEVTDEKTPRNYKAETCKWVTDIPRKIVNGPGCSAKTPNRICTGYVVCEQKQGGGKFVRMSSCRPEYCGGKDEDAVKCTKDLRYFSQRPGSESHLFVSPKLKKILEGSGSVQ